MLRPVFPAEALQSRSFPILFPILAWLWKPNHTLRLFGSLIPGVACLLAFNVALAQDENSKGLEQPKLYTWENVGEIVQISGKTFSIRRTLRISDASWSLEPGAVAEASRLQSGDQILAKGKTQTDGTFDTKRIYMISSSASRQQVGSGTTISQGADHGGPESNYPRGLGYPDDVGLEGRGRGRYPGGENRVPGPGTPGGGGKGSPGGLQNSRASHLLRFSPGDAEGVIEQVGANTLTLSQTFFMDKDTAVHQPGGKVAKSKTLKTGCRVAVTVKDEFDPKTQAMKAAVIRLLP
jgi:Domain of unknown function (DUF5666)